MPPFPPRWHSVKRSPDADALYRVQIQLLARLRAERAVPGVEVADDQAERAQGLMHRKSMSAGAGMLFVYQKTAPSTFWMENTLIPLDMLFADESGRITHIHHNAVPLDRTLISSAGPVRYVLEINAGLSRALGLSVGSELRHPSILQNLAIWPCEARS